MMDSKKQLFTSSVLLTLIFYTLANGYRCFHTLFAGDALYMIYQNDAGWEISLGRFVQPFLVMMRGAIAAPFLISILTLLWLSLSVFLVVDFLEIRKRASVAAVAAVMSCNITILSLNATFLPYLDFYIFSLFLSILGVWLLKKEKPIFLISGCLSLSASLGIYQSYIGVSIALVMIYFLCTIPELTTFKSVFKKAVHYLIPFMAAAIVYYAVWKIFQKVFDIWTADTYNGMASIGDYSQTGLGSIIMLTYQNVLNHFIYPRTFVTNTFHGISMSLFWTYLIRLCNIAVMAVILFIIVRANIIRRTKLWQNLLQLLIIVLFPLGINFVCIISKGMEHELMIYSFYFVYILAIKLAEHHFIRHGKTIQHTKKICVPRMILLASVAILSWFNIVYSNQVYLKRELQENAAHSVMTRIVHRIESMEDYIPGVTPVAFSGNFESSPDLADMGIFHDIECYSMGKTIMNYPGTIHSYLTYVLNTNMNLTQIDNEAEAVRLMPVYPAEGSIAYVDGILVVKISEQAIINE